MVVRIVTYGVESRQAAEDWVREHADIVRDVPGVENVLFKPSTIPPQVGAVMVFESDDALARFGEVDLPGRLRGTVQRRMGDGQPDRGGACWIMDA